MFLLLVFFLMPVTLFIAAKFIFKELKEDLVVSDEKVYCIDHSAPCFDAHRRPEKSGRHFNVKSLKKDNFDIYDYSIMDRDYLNDLIKDAGRF